ncbi:MAG: hypothetical protein Q9191_005273 [Dirinaria sp. TL-2023a]
MSGTSNQRSEPSTASCSNYTRRRIDPSSIYILARASSWNSSVPRNNRRPSVLRLPAEIRTRILEYVLVPKDIYLPAEPSALVTKARRLLRAQDSIETIIKRLRYPYLYDVLQIYQAQQPIKYGCQVLASCKQLYCEGYYMFYDRNTFHLAPGLLSVSSQYFDNLQPHHRALIKHLAVDTSIRDLTPKFIAELEASSVGLDLNTSLHRGGPSPLTAKMFGWMREILCSKIKYAQSWPGLADLELQHRSVHVRWASEDQANRIYSAKLLIKQQDFKVAMDRIESRIMNMTVDDRQLLKILSCSLIEVSLSVLTRVKVVGWKSFHDWLQTTALSLIVELDEICGIEDEDKVWSEDAM